MTDPLHPQDPTSAENLRDARLAHALQHMPDAHMQPSAQTRHAVLQEAMRAAGAAVSPPPTAPTPSPSEKGRWWHAWLGQPDGRVPWSAALASLAIVGFITVLWHGKDVPDAAPERAPESSTEARRKAGADASTDTANVPSAKSVADTALARSVAPSKERAAMSSAAMPERKVAASPPIAPLTLPPPPSAAAPAATTAAAKQAAPAEALADAAAPATTSANTVAPAPALVAAANTDSRADSVSKAKSVELAKVARPQAREAAALGESAGTSPVASAVTNAAPATTQSYASPSQRSVAASSERSEATAIAKLSASPTVTIAQSNVKRSVPLDKAQALLSLLRGLTYGPPSASPERLGSDADRADLVVEIAGQERWVIAPGTVHYQSLNARARGALESAKAGAGAGAGVGPGNGVLSSAITPAQYAELRRLTVELKNPP